MKFITRILITALTLLLVARFVPGIEVHGLYSALIAAFFLGCMNAVVRPLLVILTLPITILTLGLFIFVLNATLFLFVASFVDGFVVTGYMNAFIGSLCVSVISTFLNKILT